MTQSVTPRREIQRQHERAVVSDFLDWYRRHRKVEFKVIEEPNPPEAIIQSARLKRWVEVVDAFLSNAWAEDEYSYATPGRAHVPVATELITEPDAAFAHRFVAALSKKLSKTSYQRVTQAYGPGYLVLSIENPLFTRQTMNEMKTLWAAGRPWHNNGCFREVFLRRRTRNGYAIVRWEV